MNIRLKGALAIISAALLVGCTITESFATRVPPRSSTLGTIWVMKQRVLRYARLHDSLPKSTHDLPDIPGKGDDIRDAWGRDIVMSFADGKGTLVSLGRDGKPGGSGDDADMSGVFPLMDEHGAWSKEDVDWLDEPRL